MTLAKLKLLSSLLDYRHVERLSTPHLENPHEDKSKQRPEGKTGRERQSLILSLNTPSWIYPSLIQEAWVSIMELKLPFCGFYEGLS